MSEKLNISNQIKFQEAICNELINIYDFQIITSDFKLLKHNYNGYGHYFYFQKIPKLPNGTYNNLTFTIDNNQQCGAILWVDNEEIMIELYPFGDEKMPEKLTITGFVSTNKK